MPLKCNILYPVAVQPYHKVVSCKHIPSQAVAAKMGNINFGLSLEVARCVHFWLVFFYYYYFTCF